MFLQICRHSSFLTYLLVGVTTWCDDYRVRELLNGVGVRPHAEGNDGSMRWQREAQFKIEIVVVLFCEETRICERVCQQSPDFGGKPKEVPHSFHFQTGGRTSGLQMNTRPQREQMCAPPFGAAAPVHTSHTLPSSQPSRSIYDCQLPPAAPTHPPHPPTPLKLVNTPADLQTNKSLGSPVILCFVFVV